ncbi:MAG: T9SS type A sorting domain-containing protein [bacterium]|nr:T9SS type A sorting domain-containing protein [bacterium]
MKHNYFKIFRTAAASAIVAAMFSAEMLAQTTVSQTFSFTGGTQSFTVPSACAPSMTIEVRAASGGAGGTSGPAGANGGIVRAIMTNISGQVFYVNVGGQGSVTAGGFNGGGGGGTSSSTQGAGGGGASDVRIGTNALTSRVIVAGGGGGGGGSSSYAPTPGAGGAGSSFTASSGFGGGGSGGCASGATGGEYGGGNGGYGSGGGGGGFLSGGDGGGQPSATTGGYGCIGTLGNGGAGGGTSYVCGGATGGINGGGGGGGGYYGGGGGMTGTGGCNGGGGGGSSWTNNLLMNSITYTAGGNSGNGIVIITYTYNGPALSATSTHSTLCVGTTATLAASGVSSYTWVSLSNNNSSITVSPSTLTSYTVQGTNSLGCVSNAVITITANPGAPVLSITTSTTQLCLGKSASVTASGAFTYTWTGGISNGVPFSPSVTTSYVVTGQNACGTSTAVTTITVAPLGVSVLASPNLVCQGYPTTLTAVSSATGYTWQPAAAFGATITTAPMANTIYTVSVSDGTCSGTATLLVTTKTTPTVTASSTSSTICQGASAVLTASGAVSYSWTPLNLSGTSVTVSPSTSASYIVYGTNSLGCTASANQVVLVNPSPTISITANKSVACVGDLINMMASGANTYNWTNGPATPAFTVIPTSSTVYSVTGLLNGNPCPGSNTISIAIIVPNVTVASSPTAVCTGGSATLTAGGATSYTWNGIPGSSSQVVAPAGTSVYNLTANTQSNSVSCITTKTLQVFVNPNPTITVVSTKSLTCKGNSNTLTASGASTYTWSTGASTNPIVVNPNTNTIYTLTGTDAKGCQGTQLFQAVVSACNGISELAKGNQHISVYPNPSAGDFSIETTTDIVLRLMNNIGQQLRVISLTEANEHKANVKDLANGVYFLVGENAVGKVNQKIVVAR